MTPIAGYPFVSFEFDVFLSYARLDDAEGCVTAFEAQLHEYLARRLPREPRIWRDVHALDPGDDQFEISINDALMRSAVLLVVLSPAFSTREWFRKEMGGFLREAADVDRMIGRIGTRMFIVLKSFTDRDQLPAFVKQLRDFPFELDESLGQLIGAQDYKANRKYFDGLYGLFERIASEIQIVKGEESRDS